MTHEDTIRLIEHYRRLVGCLLEHSYTDTEGTEEAIADFLKSEDRASDILRGVMSLQKALVEDNQWG